MISNSLKQPLFFLIRKFPHRKTASSIGRVCLTIGGAVLILILTIGCGPILLLNYFALYTLYYQAVYLLPAVKLCCGKQFFFINIRLHA